MEYRNEMELDLRDLFYYVKKRLWVIAGAFILCAVLGFLFSTLFMTPKYEASTRMYVLNRTNETNVVYADIQTSTYLSTDYEVLITGQNVTKEVIDILKLSNMTPERLERKLEVTTVENTRVLQITVKDKDPKLAADIANCVREVAADQIQKIMDVDAVKLVYEADVPQKPASPNVMLNTMIAAVFGMFVAVFVFVLAYMTDDTIRTEEDVERYLGLSTMGVIPLSGELVATGKRKKKNKGAVKAKTRGA